jgi:hypothetical protein
MNLFRARRYRSLATAFSLLGLCLAAGCDSPGSDISKSDGTTVSPTRKKLAEAKAKAKAEAAKQ